MSLSMFDAARPRDFESRRIVSARKEGRKEGKNATPLDRF